MNRLAPLIVRTPARSGPARAWAVATALQQPASQSEDLRTFLTAFLGGVVFFSAFLF